MSKRTPRVCLVLASMIGLQSPALADTNQLKVQGPWAYMKRSDGPASPANYMATTAAIEDRDTFFVLSCGKDEQVSAAIIRTDGFPFRVGSSLLQVSLRLDDSTPVGVPAAPIEAKQIALHPRAARDLVPLLVHSRTMVASVPEANGLIHIYSFSLQPNDLALRDIEFRCYHPGT